MKTMKRALALVLALSMVLALGLTTVLAADETAGVNNSSGKITIGNAVAGQTYTVYQILKLESYDNDAKAYAYKATAAWADFITRNDIKGTYVNVDDQGYVTWIDGADAAAFAKLAQAYAANNKIANQGEKKAEAEAKTVEFTGLNLGYYLVDSTLGTLCSLDTTNPTVTIQEKNAAPTNVKTVEEDSNAGTDKAYGEKNDADIGQTVNFKSTITAQAGAQNYVFHDTMSAGLSYTGVTGVTLNGNPVADGSYTVVTEGLDDGCTFEVRFTQEFCDTLTANDQIVISYSAVLTKDAVVAGEGNPNESKLTYGDAGTTETTPSVTKTYTWKMDVFKHNAEEKGLAGAKFVLSKNLDGSNPIALINSGNNTYRVATTDEAADAITEITTDQAGKFTITGLDSDTYYLIETAAPAGYNMLKDAVKVTISDQGAITVNGDAIEGTTVSVLNNTGAELPSTGGIGTTVFYVVGALLVVCAGVLLITRKRMRKEG